MSLDISRCVQKEKKKWTYLLIGKIDVHRVAKDYFVSRIVCFVGV